MKGGREGRRKRERQREKERGANSQKLHFWKTCGALFLIFSFPFALENCISFLIFSCFMPVIQEGYPLIAFLFSLSSLSNFFSPLCHCDIAEKRNNWNNLIFFFVMCACVKGGEGIDVEGGCFCTLTKHPMHWCFTSHLLYKILQGAEPYVHPIFILPV